MTEAITPGQTLSSGSSLGPLDNEAKALKEDTEGSLGKAHVKPVHCIPTDLHYTIEKVRWIEGKIIHDIGSKDGHDQVVIENNGRLRANIYELKSGGHVIAVGKHSSFLSPVANTWTTEVFDEKGALIGSLKLRSGAFDTAHIIDIVNSSGSVCAHTIFSKGATDKVIFRFPKTDEELFRFTPEKVGKSVRWDLDIKRGDLVDARVLKILSALVSQNVVSSIHLQNANKSKEAGLISANAKEGLKWTLAAAIALVIFRSALA